RDVNARSAQRQGLVRTDSPGHREPERGSGGPALRSTLHHERIPGRPATHHAAEADVSGTLTSSECALSRRRPISASSGGPASTRCSTTPAHSASTRPSGHPVATLRSACLAAVGSRSCRGMAWVIVSHRANLWALRSAGVRQVLALSAVGSLRTDLPPGSLVIPDQILDRTSGRAHTYMDADNGVFHVAYADPYCPVGRACALAAGGVTGLPVQPAATMVVVNGPRFSTRAESQEFQRAGAAIIGMTGMPEAGLARELALCYTTLTLVTDLDAGIEIGSGVTQTEVFEQFAANVPRLRTLLGATIEQLPPGQTELCECGRVYDEVPPPFQLP